MTTAVVFDYGFGNVRSMVRALANLGVDTTLTSDYRQSLEADGLVVPGVGAFAACMEGLKKVDGDRVIYDRIRAGRPVLGVCVGEQIMFEHGLEHGAHAAGIGLIGGSVNLLDADVVPHMGWVARMWRIMICCFTPRTCARGALSASRRSLIPYDER